jgi:acetylornithine/succinyldiaminopimelate/putrescine aminotransferase
MGDDFEKGRAAVTMSVQEKRRIEDLFGRHINRAQLKYLKAAHLDVLETQRNGVRFVDPVTGRAMYDCFTSAGSFNVSRHNPAVMQALEEALDDLDMGSYNMVSAPKIDLAKKLSSLAPGDLKGVLLAASGGDAIDCAIKLARGATQRSEILATVKAYHGHTGFALSANGKEHYRCHFEPLMPGFSFVPFNDLEAMRRRASKDTAAILLEPVQGEAGIFPASDAYLKGLRQLCDEQGIALIFDEIQTAFGRTGKLFACQHSGVIPDIMTVAKSLSGALYPNAAVLYRRVPRLVDFIDSHPDFHVTHGGSDIACRVSLKALEYIEQNRLWENAERMGTRLKETLVDLMRENPKIIKEVRGIGLMVGLEYGYEFMGPMMADALAKRGVFAVYSGNAPQVMRFMAPITVSRDELQEIIAAIRGAVQDMKKLLPLALVAARVPGVVKLLNSERVQAALFGFLRRFERPAGGAINRSGR